MELKPITAGQPSMPEGISYGEALRRARAVEALMESEGWAVLMEAVDDFLDFDQHQFSIGSVKPPYEYTALLYRGRWEGIKQVTGIAKGVVARGKAAEAELQTQGA